jgi:hypothetical protein
MGLKSNMVEPAPDNYGFMVFAWETAMMPQAT